MTTITEARLTAEDLDELRKVAEAATESALLAAGALLDKLMSIGLILPPGRDHFGRSPVGETALRTVAAVLLLAEQRGGDIRARALAAEYEELADASNLNMTKANAYWLCKDLAEASTTPTPEPESNG